MGGACCGGEANIPNPTEEKLVLATLKRNQEQQMGQAVLLFLGVGGTGKSTFFKQLTRIHGGGISARERRSYGQQIQEQLTAQMKLLAHRCEMTYDLTHDPDFAFEDSDEVRTALNTLRLHPDETELTPELVECVKILWRDKGIQKGWEDRARLCIFDCSGYFWDDIDRVGLPDYRPTDEDCIMLRNPTTGMAQKTFTMHGQRVKIVDVGGQRSERRKWMHLFEGVTAVIFIASLSAYDEFLYEDHQQNVMEEQLQVFKQTVNMRWFENTPIILFLNKDDLFRKKIEVKDLTQLWPQYKGGLDYDRGLSYIKKQFKKKNKNDLRIIYSHVTCARDKDNVERVFTDVTHTLVDRQMGAADLL